MSAQPHPKSSVKNTVSKLLAHPQFFVVLAILAIILTLPSASSGLGADDMIQREILLAKTPSIDAPNPWLDLFRFGPGEGVMDKRLRQNGQFAWWAHPEVRVVFLRPITVATHLLDYAFWPDTYWLQHLHSILWYALTVLMVLYLYRRLNPSMAVAGLAGICFAVEDAHALPVGWIAHRNLLVAAVFAVGSIILHHKWRDSKQMRFLFLALLVFLVGMLASEAAVAALAYIIAYQIALDQGPLFKRLQILIPYAVILLFWLLVYSHLGFGAYGSDLYISPSSNPTAFTAAVIERLPMLLWSQFLQLPIDISLIFPHWLLTLFWTLSIIGVLLLGLFFYPLLKACPYARFWALGMLMAVVPTCATLALDRMLFFVGMGAFGVIACQIHHMGWLSEEGISPKASIRGKLVVIFLFLHIVLAAPMLAIRSAAMPLIFEKARMGTQSITDDPALADHTVVMLTGSDYVSYNLQAWRRFEGLPGPARVGLLLPVATPFMLQRTDDRTLYLYAQNGFFHHLIERATRDLSLPFQVGWHTRTEDFELKVTEVVDGRPMAIQIRFFKPLEDSSLHFYYTRNGELQPFDLPSVGEKRMMPSGFEDIF